MILIEQASSSAAHWSAQRYRDLFSDTALRRLTLVVEEQGVVGFIVALVADVEWEIENVVVQEGLRRRGLGRALVVEALTRARKEDAHSIFLEVRASNLAARQLYQSIGFKEVAQRFRYYSHPQEDAIVYRFEIV